MTQLTLEVRAIAKNARHYLRRAVEVADDDCWLLVADQADRLQECADEMREVARRGKAAEEADRG